MPDRLPTLRAQEVVRALERSGFTVKRQTGSHVILAKPELHRPVVVPMHRRDLPRALVLDIIRQAGLTVDEFAGQL
jgi:predicted RNA binding protein YcfA (HicA-like mRNA interferase family)